MFSKERREHNTNRVGEAFRGDEWSPEQSHVKVIGRDAQTVAPNKPKQSNPLEKTAGFENPHGKWSFKVGDIVNMAASKGKLNTFNPQIFAPQLEGRLGESTEENRSRTNAVDMSHPIVVLKHPDGTHSLLDGTHRVQNALEKGMKSINARIVTHKDMQQWQQ